MSYTTDTQKRRKRWTGHTPLALYDQGHRLYEHQFFLEVVAVLGVIATMCPRVLENIPVSKYIITIEEEE